MAYLCSRSTWRKEHPRNEATLAGYAQTCINCLVAFEWDATKAANNLKKHGVDFADACVVLSDTLALTFQDSGRQSEQRHITIGMDSLARVLVVVYTWRGEDVRLISARKATPSERKQYEARP